GPWAEALLHMHKGGVSIAPPLKRGLGYLALDPDDTVLSFVRFQAAARTPFLWMTSDQPQATVDGGDVLRVTTLRGIGNADPRRLKDLRAAATTFFDERGPGALVLDCLAPLVLHSGVERLLRLRPFERWDPFQQLGRAGDGRFAPLDHDVSTVPFQAQALRVPDGHALAAHDVVGRQDIRLVGLGRRQAEDSVHVPPHDGVR